MARPFSQLPQVLREREKKFLRVADVRHRDAARSAGFTAVNATRVDTGLARSNWVGSISVPESRVIPPYAPGGRLGIGETGNLLGATNQQKSVIARWVPSRQVPLFITNNVSYIATLDRGGPTVSAGSMLAQAVQSWKASLITKAGARF